MSKTQIGLLSAEVPKDEEFVNVSIELWDKNNKIDFLCDISADDGNFTQARTAEIIYSIATGVWWGDDSLGDPSGYGRLNGCDDNSIYQQDRDCELWFDISQNDFDEDGFPYWLETNVYNTSPLVDNRGEDADQDGIPIEWEHTFGLTYFEWGHDEGYYMIYDPFFWENYTDIDDDNDGLNNIEEYKTWQWGSDPFRQDIFIELDQMEKEPVTARSLPSQLNRTISYEIHMRNIISSGISMTVALVAVKSFPIKQIFKNMTLINFTGNTSCIKIQITGDEVSFTGVSLGIMSPRLLVLRSAQELVSYLP